MMKKFEIDYTLLQKSSDAEVQRLTSLIDANREVIEAFDQSMEDELLEQLTNLLQEKLESLLEEQQLEAQEALEMLDIEDIINYDVPKELSEDINSLALDDTSIVEKNILKSTSNPALESKIYDKIININLNDKHEVEREIEVGW